MRHFLSGFFRARLSGCGGKKADFVHFRCPLFIMVALTRRLAIVVLPQMYHFMDQGCEYLDWFLSSKVDRVQCDLIGYVFWICNTCKPRTGEIAERSFVAL